tara:strand:+ start:902 stop:1519 length:618 start_codon:yes stop_codon:yes gene_type:complete
MKRHSDSLLLEQAYQATQLKENFSNLTVDQVRLVIENATSMELEVLEELLGKIRNAASGVGNVLKAGKEAIQGAATNAVAGAKDVAAGVGAGAKAAAGQVKDNVKGMYKAGVDKNEAAKRKSQLLNHVAQLEDLFAAHIEASPDSRLKKTKLNDITIKQLKLAIGATASAKAQAATKARLGGFMGQAGAAFQKGYEKEQKARKGE